jgi:hypothetical protein
MKTTHVPSLKNMTDDEIFDYYDDHVSPENSLSFIYHILDECPETGLNLVEMFEQIPEYNNSDYGSILEFAERYRKIHPDKYRQEYGFIEQKLTEHAFDAGNVELLNRCLEIIAENPVTGIDAVTMKTLYRLIYFGMYEKAVDYSQKVWKPIAESDQMMFNPELKFINVIYLDGVEREYEKFSQGDTSGWEAFNRSMNAFGIEQEQERIDLIFKSLTRELENDHILASVKKEPQNGFIELLHHFMKFMKNNYNLPFMHSYLWFQFLMKSSLFGNRKEALEWFYIPYPIIDKHVTAEFDSFWQSNIAETGGRVWGLHYVYEFLYENLLISSECYQMMLENLAWLKMDFLTVVRSEAWQLKFVSNWPETDSDLVKLPENFFDSVDIKDDQNALAQIKNLLPHVDGKERIIEEMRSVTGKKNKTNQYGPSQIAGTEIPTDPNRYVRRNDPCPCGSGKKFKKCCLGKGG